MDFNEIVDNIEPIFFAFISFLIVYSISEFSVYFYPNIAPFKLPFLISGFFGLIFLIAVRMKKLAFKGLTNKSVSFIILFFFVGLFILSLNVSTGIELVDNYLRGFSSGFIVAITGFVFVEQFFNNLGRKRRQKK
ncbi:MAG: hypothetical protein ABIH20_02380 [Candidatus Diapherotrites archaeon]